MEPMALSLNQRQYVEAVIAALPHLAEAVAAIPPDCQVKAFEAAERSYLRTFRQLGLSGPETWASSVMRRLRRRVREAGLTEKDKLKKLYEQISTNEHLSILSVEQAHRFATHETASSGEAKNRGRDGEFDKLKLYEQISTNEHLSLPSVGQAHRFATPQATSSEEAKNHARDGDKLKLYEQLSTDEQIGQAPSFGRHEAAPSGDQKNVGREGEFDKLKSYEQLSADECLETVPRQAHRFATHEAGPSGEQKNLGKEGDFDKLKLYEQLPAGKQVTQAPSFGIHDTASSGEKNDVGREGEVDKLKSYEQLSADECLETLRQADGTHDAASSGEQKDVGREGESDKLKLYEQLSAGEQIGQASSFDIHVAASSREEKDVGREGAKKAAVALRMAKFLINVDEIFDDERLPGTDEVRHIREKSRTPEKRLTTRW